MRDILTETALWFQKAVARPTNKNLHTQLGCHLEEINETLQVVSTQDFETEVYLSTAKAALFALANHLKNSDDVIFIKAEDREEYLDGLCDTVVTATGCAHMSDLDLPGGMVEVNRSNFSKFCQDTGEPIFNDNLKVMKGPAYSKPDLAPFI